MAATAGDNAGLEVSIGISINRLTQQLAAAEARMAKAAKRAEEAFSKANPAIVDGMAAPARRAAQEMENVGDASQRMSSAFGGAGNNVQMLSQQLSQVAQQTMATGNFIQALAIQLPDMAMGFGAMGAAAGVVAGITLPLLANAVMGAADKGKVLADALEAVSEAVADYRELIEQASASTEEMEAKFGSAAPRMQAVAGILAEMAKLNAIDAIEALNVQMVEMFEMQDRIKPLYLAEMFNLDGWTGIVDGAKDEVFALRDALEGMRAAQGASVAEQEVAAQKLLSAYIDIAKADGEISDNEREFVALLGQAIMKMEEQVKLQADAALEAVGFKDAVEAAQGAMAAVSGYADGLAAKFAAAAAKAWQMADATAAAAMSGAAQPRVQATGPYAPGANSFGNPYAGEGGAGPTTSPRPQRPDVNSYGSWLAAGSRGGRRGGGGGSKSEKESLYELGQKEIAQAERKLDLIGKTEAAEAALAVKYQLLDEAKKRGLDLDAKQAQSGLTLREQIDQQAAAVGRLAAQEEDAAERAAFLVSIQDDLKTGFLDAIIAGESFSDVLKNVAGMLAKAALEAALFGSGPFGGGGGLLSGLGAALFSSFDGGGYTGGGVRMGGLDGKGGRLALLHPRETVIDHTKGQSAGGAIINISVSGASGDDHVIDLVRQGVTAGLQQYDKALPVRFDEIAKNPRAR